MIIETTGDTKIFVRFAPSLTDRRKFLFFKIFKMTTIHVIPNNLVRFDLSLTVSEISADLCFLNFPIFFFILKNVIRSSLTIQVIPKCRLFCFISIPFLRSVQIYVFQKFPRSLNVVIIENSCDPKSLLVSICL